MPSSAAVLSGVELGNALLAAIMGLVSALGIGVLAGSVVVGVGAGLVVLLATVLVLVAV